MVILMLTQQSFSGSFLLLCSHVCNSLERIILPSVWSLYIYLNVHPSEHLRQGPPQIALAPGARLHAGKGSLGKAWGGGKKLLRCLGNLSF